MVVAVDLFVNAGLLVNAFTGDDPALLPNTEAAKRFQLPTMDVLEATTREGTYGI